ncbi:MAG TPA: hypothetical protein PLD54_00305 [Candidatus Levybacteria bacterium]|nr:hypothetical protein [Candidatus Levybacteria bacterium]
MTRKIFALFIVVGIVCIIAIGAIILLNLPKESTPPSDESGALPTPYPLKSKENLPVFSIQKTKIGQTTETELHNLPIIKEETLPDNSKSYEISSHNPFLPNQVIAKNGTVIFERILYPTSTTSSDRTRLSTLLDKYGQAENIIIGSNEHGPEANIYSYSSKGFVIIGNPYIDYVLEIQVFYPMSTDNYIKYYGTPHETDSHEHL